MKDLLKKYIDKGYEPSFFWKRNLINMYEDFAWKHKAEKLELYLMR